MSVEIFKLLCSAMKLERDRGVTELQKKLATASPDDIKSFQASIHSMFHDSGASWEVTQGALLGTKALIPFNRLLTKSERDHYVQEIIVICLELLTHREVRVRLDAGEVIGLLCHHEGKHVYEKCCDYVLNLITSNLERDLDSSNSSVSVEDEEDPSSPTRKEIRVKDGSQILHDTAGWKFLETSMKCLQAMVDNCGIEFWKYINQPLLEILFKTVKHTNRFVRETGFYVIGSLVTCGNTKKGSHKDAKNPFTPEKYGHEIAACLALGLSDNWSQVRLAASEATRKFLLSFSTESEREVFYPVLLPQMCLNRYYVADGVRIYSQETWRRIAKTEGRELVQKYIQPVVDHYISQTLADNHAVREAACACIAELASKIKKDAVRPYVPRLLDTLLICFRDDSWAVRDAACLACGHFMLCFPEESRSSLESLYPLFFENLQDCIPSVRQGAAAALANVVRAYGDSAFIVLEEKIKNGLRDVENQPSESIRYGQVEWGPATFSMVKRLRDNDADLHTDKQMYSCGSLAPKMGRGAGCSGHKFRKPPEPWELADGCIHLVAELAQVPEVSAKVTDFLPLMAEAAQHRHYSHHVCLLESLCKQLPNIAKSVNKKVFKTHLESFFDAIFYSLNSENGLTSSAASQCLNQLASLLGASILRARVEQWNPRYLEQLDANLHIAGF